MERNTKSRYRMQVLNVVFKKGSTTEEEIAREVGCSVRTVSNQIRYWMDIGMPVYTEPGGGGGVRVDDRKYRYMFKDMKVSAAEIEQLEELCEMSPSEMKPLIIKVIRLLSGYTGF